MDLRESQYFRSLPAHIQESVMQSGVHFENEEEVNMFLTHIGNGEE